MFGLGAPELIIIVLIIALMFGGKKIPELMKGLGSGIKEFKKASNVDEPAIEVKKEDKTNSHQ